MDVGPEQHHEQTSDSTKASKKPKTSLSYGLIGQVAKLMGKTAGLVQDTGTKTADSIFAAGRQTGKLLDVPSKLLSLAAYGAKKQRKAETEVEIERLRYRIERLYARIGERICHSLLFDRTLLQMDPQLEALVSTVRELEYEVHDLHNQAQIVAEESCCPRYGASESADKTQPLCTKGLQASESTESVPSPAPKEEEAPLLEAE